MNRLNTTAACAIEYMIDLFAFWRIRDPGIRRDRGIAEARGSRFRKLKDHAFPRAVLESDPIVGRAIMDWRASLFEYRHHADEQDFYIECEDPELRAKLEQAFFRRAWRTPSPYGPFVHDLADFFRNVTSALLVRGRSWHRIRYLQASEPDNKWGFRIDWLEEESVKPNTRRGKVKGYQVKVVDRNVPGVTNTQVDIVAPCEILVFEWPLGQPGVRTKLPLKQMEGLHRKRNEFLTLMLAHSYAVAQPNDKRLWVERARFADVFRGIAETREDDVRIRSILGTYEPVGFDVPMTSYYQVYTYVEFQKRVARVREYLAQTFSKGVVEPLASRIKPDGTALLRLKGYPSVGDLERIFRRFVSGEITDLQVLREIQGWATPAERSPADSPNRLET